MVLTAFDLLVLTSLWREVAEACYLAFCRVHPRLVICNKRCLKRKGHFEACTKYQTRLTRHDFRSSINTLHTTLRTLIGSESCSSQPRKRYFLECSMSVKRTFKRRFEFDSSLTHVIFSSTVIVDGRPAWVSSLTSLRSYATSRPISIKNYRQWPSLS